MSSISYDLQQLYQRQFGTKPVVPALQEPPKPVPMSISGSNPDLVTKTGSALYEQYRDQEVWLPVNFQGLDVSIFGVSKLLMPHTTVKMSAKKTIVKTPLAERQGTVKELFSIEDYSITIKGFLIGYDKSGKYPIWPEEELKILKKLWELNEAIELDNALTDIFLSGGRNVVIESLDIPEVSGGRKHIRPFSMTLESDTIFTLELN